MEVFWGGKVTLSWEKHNVWKYSNIFSSNLCKYSSTCRSTIPIRDCHIGIIFRCLVHEWHKAMSNSFSTIPTLSGCLSALGKSSLARKDKQKWKAVFIKEFVSWEESDSDSETNSNVLVKRVIPWWSSKVTDYYDLDKPSDKAKSSQSKRQKTHVLSGESSQPVPIGMEIPCWAVRDYITAWTLLLLSVTGVDCYFPGIWLLLSGIIHRFGYIFDIHLIVCKHI